MKYEQLERCYRAVLKQRDEAETKVVKLTHQLDDALEAQSLDINEATTHGLAKILLNAPNGDIKCSVDVVIGGCDRKVFGEFSEVNSLPTDVGFGSDIAMLRFDGNLET